MIYMVFDFIINHCGKFTVSISAITYLLIVLMHCYHDLILTYITLCTFSISLIFMFMIGIKQCIELKGV